MFGKKLVFLLPLSSCEIRVFRSVGDWVTPCWISNLINN